MIELNHEQHLALQDGDNRVVDPTTDSRYVLVHEETYKKWNELFRFDALTVEERRVILQGVWDRAGWSDSVMDAYDSLPDES